MNTTKKILTAAFTTLALATGGLAYADYSPAKHAALQNAPVSAAQAVKTAADKIGGRAIKVDFEHTLNRSYYDVDVVRGNDTHEVRVDAKSGQVVRSKMDHDDDDAMLPEVKVSLQQAITAAVQKTGGKAKDAELKAKYGNAHYRVDTLANGQEHQTVIDANSGAVLSSHIDLDD